jgi:hypothetical protein
VQLHRACWLSGSRSSATALPSREVHTQQRRIGHTSGDAEGHVPVDLLPPHMGMLAMILQVTAAERASHRVVRLVLLCHFDFTLCVSIVGVY